jgi:hypothetical protein
MLTIYSESTVHDKRPWKGKYISRPAGSAWAVNSGHGCVWRTFGSLWLPVEASGIVSIGWKTKEVMSDEIILLCVALQSLCLDN